MDELNIKANGMTISLADYLSNLMYSYKYSNKKQYFMALDRLKPFIDEPLYTFFFRFGHAALWKV